MMNTKAVFELLQSYGVECEQVENAEFERFVPINKADERNAIFINPHGGKDAVEKRIEAIRDRKPALIIVQPESADRLQDRARSLIACDDPRLAFSLIHRGGAYENEPLGVVYYYGVTVGKHCRFGSYTVLGAEGLNINRFGDIYENTPHMGRLIIEDYVQTGVGCVLQRAVLGETRIGKGSLLAHHVDIGHGVALGQRCIIAANSVVSGSAKIGNDVFIGPGCTIKNNIKIGDNVFVGMGSNVIKDVPPGVVVAGNPARIKKGLERPW